LLVTTPLAKVQLGLRLCSAALWIVTGAVLLFLSVVLYALTHRTSYFYSTNYPGRSDVMDMTEQIALSCGWMVAFGLVVGFFGRFLCLAMPDATLAGRARLAVIFEGCGVLSAAGFMVATRYGRLPEIVDATFALFSVLTMYIGRMQFLRFTRSLAERIAPARVPKVVGVQRMFLYVPCAFLLAVGVSAAGAIIIRHTDYDFAPEFANFFTWLIASVAFVAATLGVLRWGVLLNGMRASVAEFARQQVEEPTDDDPDAEYRRRYNEGELIPS
jgi:hypothetical protein